MKHTVLVYGTLRPGLGKEVLVKGQMFDLGAFPGVKLGGDDVFVAEQVEVEDDVLSGLDRYEGYYEDSPEHSLYIRRRYTDPLAGVDAWVYEYNSEPDPDRAVVGGDWLAYSGKERGGAHGLLLGR